MLSVNKKMKNKLKTILIISIAIFSAGFLLVLPANAQVDGLVVEYWTGTEWKPLVGPLFDEANFLPGEGIMRWVKVTNNSGQSQRIAAEAINVSDPNRLGDALNLEIKEGVARLYNGPLPQFFNAGEVYLSDLGGGNQAQYDFTVTFYSGANNAFQGKTLGFDILIGFQGTEGGLTPGGGGGGGGFLPSGLTITNESTEKIEATEVIITWLTSYSSTSQVIYAAEGENYSFDLTKSNYGYPHAFPDPEDSTKLISHSVTLTDLTPGTTYYYRCVSHGSLAVSTEHSFTTLGASIGEEEPSYAPEAATEGKEEPASAPGGVTAGKEEKEETVGGLEKPELVEVGVEEPTGLGNFLAAVGAFPFNLKVILIIIGLILIGLLSLWLIKKKKERKEGSV